MDANDFQNYIDMNMLALELCYASGSLIPIPFHPSARLNMSILVFVNTKWSGRPENIKEANKQAEIYVGWPCTSLLYVHRLCMNYITAMLLLVRFMSTRNHLLHFASFYVESTSNMANKNVQQELFQVSKPCSSIN